MIIFAQIFQGRTTSKLQTALKGVNTKIRNTQSQLRDVEKLLKLDPGNTELLAQRHRLLGQAVSETKERMETLKTAAEQANTALANGEISQEQYDALQREIIETENALRNLEQQANQSATAEALVGKNAMSGFLALMNAAPADIEKLGGTIADCDGTAASGVWELIKNVILGPALLLIDLVTGNITKLREDALGNWTNIQQAAIVVFPNMVSGIRSALSSLGSVVSGGFQSAISFITSLLEKALQWGMDFINGIADGIRSAIGNVVSAVSDVAEKICSFLHFSVPDEGPVDSM